MTHETLALTEAAALGIDPLIPRRRAFRMCGFSTSTGDRRERDDPDFPPRVLIGPKRWAYRASDIARWIDSRPVLQRYGDTSPANDTAPLATKVAPPKKPGRRLKKATGPTAAA